MKLKLKRIDWYIIKQFLGTYVFAIALIISISVVFDINEKIDKFLNPDVPLKAIIAAQVAMSTVNGRHTGGNWGKTNKRKTRIKETIKR